ncbi:MAG: AMP-binding protein [Alphaproteobacteria bacterium]|nr:AMP-binding protein [Alphaproteobacteria bacterium]
MCTERIRDDELDGVDLSSWRMALDGAEPIRPATLEAFAARFARWGFAPEALQPVYGLSEAALAVTATPPLRGPRRITAAPLPLAEGRLERAAEGVTLVSVGPPLPGFEVRIVDEAGQALPEGRVGQIQARGPSVMQGYLDRADQPFVDGWLRTGDLGLMDAGELIVTGRAKDVLVHRGRNHAPQDLEQAADTVPGVRTGCVVAVADLDEGERLYLLAEVREPHEGQADAVLAAVREATGVTVDAVLLLAPGTLPRTSSGKLRRGEALRQLREGTLAPPRAVTPWMLAGALGDSLLGHLAARWGRR